MCLRLHYKVVHIELHTSKNRREKKVLKKKTDRFFFAASKGRRPFPRTSSSALMFDRPTRYHNYDSEKSNTKSNRT
jgi:hypothetical protein